MDKVQNAVVLESDLSCNAEDAKKLIRGSLAHLLKPFPLSFGSIKGIDIGDYSYIIWEVSGWKNFGFPLTYCKLTIVPHGDNSHISGRINFTWPLRFFNFGGKVVAPVVFTLIISWLLLVLGSIFPTFGSFTAFYAPIFILSLLLLIFRLTRMFAEEQVNDLSTFIQRIFERHIVK